MLGLCCNKSTIDQVITNPPFEPNDTNRTTAVNTHDGSMRSHQSRRDNINTLDDLMDKLDVREKEAILRHDQTGDSNSRVHRSRIGSGLFANVYEIHLFNLDESNQSHELVAALKIPKPGQQAEMQKEFKNEMHLYHSFKQLLDNNIPAIEKIKTLFDISNKDILDSSVMVRGFRLSHNLFPENLVGIMPLIDCDRKNVADLFNQLLDVEDIDQQQLMVHNFLTGMRDLAIVLAVYEACEIIHNDIKPENLAIDLKGNGHLLDHGLVEKANEPEHDEASGGTLNYAAPERIRNGGHHDTRADLFSLGTTLAEVFLGRVPIVTRTAEGETKINFDIFTEIEEATEETLGERFICDLRHLVYPSRTNDHKGLVAPDPNDRPSALETAIFLQKQCDHFGLKRPMK